MKKALTALVVLTMVFTFTLPPKAEAQTVAELQAQISNLLNLIGQLQARLAALGGGTGTTTPGTLFMQNLTIGSTGMEVVRLQQFLVARGFLTMPPGVSFGYFGPLTRAALARFQASQGISPAVGFFGPITRARINAIIGTTTPPVTGTTTPPTGITTPGVEGIMSVTSFNAGLRSSVFEGEEMVPILGMKIEAKRSDIAVQRVEMDLGTTSTIYNKILERLHVTDGTNTLASIDLNTSNVIREGNRHSITITGFNFIVPRDSERNLVIKADVRPSIDSELEGDSFTIRLSDNGVRGIDGAGIDHFAPADGTSISRSITPQESLAEAATLRLSLGSDTPREQEIVADEGVNNDELDRATVLIFDLRAEKDDVTLDDLRVNISKTGTGGADASSTAYLFDGNTEIDNAPISGGSATFQNLDFDISRGTTKSLSIKVDIRDADNNLSFITASIPASGIVAQNSLGDTISTSDISGSATGYEIGFRDIGPEITLVSKSVTTNGVPQASDETSFLTATFNLRIRAVDGDVILGTPGSTTPAFDASGFGIYRNGVLTSVATSAISVSYSVPTGANTAGLTNAFRITEGNEVNLTVTVQVRGRVDGTALTPGLYSVALESFTWVADSTSQTSDFMRDNVDWRTNDVSFP